MQKRPRRWLRIGARKWVLIGMVGIAVLRSGLPALPDVIRDVGDHEPIIVAIHDGDSPDNGEQAYDPSLPYAVTSFASGSPFASGTPAMGTLEDVVRSVAAMLGGSIQFAVPGYASAVDLPPDQPSRFTTISSILSAPGPYLPGFITWDDPGKMFANVRPQPFSRYGYLLGHMDLSD